MVREDLVKSAIAFLQDSSVASSTLDQRISFLQSKNLTQEEIDLSLARAGDGSVAANPALPSQPAGNQPNYAYRSQEFRGRQPRYGYDPYQGGSWGMLPEPPRRDWRDWFIMATVSSGVSYGLYVFAKRYILPLISPPTPPQLAADKAAIDEQFSRAFALIDQLAADTASIKSAEAERTEKLDTTLRDVESVISDLKTANSRRETESRILADQVHGLKDLVPKALEGWKAAEDKKLEELSSELRSLKLLVANRLGGGGGGGAGAAASHGASSRSTYSGMTAKEKPESSGPSESAPGAANSGEDFQQQQQQQQQQSTRTGSGGSKFGLPLPLQKQEGASRYQSGGKVAIPSWQMAATAGSGSGSGNGGGGGSASGGAGGGGGAGAGGSGSSSALRSEEDTEKDRET